MSETPTLDQLRATLSHIASAYWMAANWRDGDARQRMEHVQWLEEALSSLLADRERLTWIRDHRTEVAWGIQSTDGARREGYFLKTRPRWTYLATDFIEAIDAARHQPASPIAQASLENPISIDASRSGDTK